MVVSKRAVVLRSLLSVVLLLAALAPYGAMLAGMQDGAFVSIFATPIFLVSSQIAGIGAITSASGIANPRKRRVLIWSLVAITSALAALIIWFGGYIVAATPYCTNTVTANGCRFGLAAPALFCAGAFAVASIAGTFAAPILALADAARGSQWLWFAALLLILLGSLAASGLLLVPLGVSALQPFDRHDWPTIIQVCAPFVLPVVALFYSYTRRKKPLPADIDMN